MYQSKRVRQKQYFKEIQVQGNEILSSRYFVSAVTSEEILRGMMFTYVLRRENPFNQIIYTSTLSSMAFRLLAEQCDSVQKTFLISRYVLQKMIPEAMEKCKFLSKML